MTLKVVGAKRPATTLPSFNKTFSFKQLEELWVQAGGNQTAAPTMAAIALAESKGDPTIENTGYTNKEGLHPAGLWQINEGGKGDLLNPLTNAKNAVEKLKSQGFSAWETFTNGDYKPYLSSTNLQSGISDKEAIQNAGVPGVNEAGEAIEKTIEETLNWEGPVEKIVLTGVLLLAGAVLIVYGIMVAVRPRESALSLPKMPVPVPV